MADEKKGYVPPPSIGHELGVMFGFIGFMLLAFILYAVVFSIYNKRWERKEQDRLAALRASGYGPVDEKDKVNRQEHVEGPNGVGGDGR